MGTFVSQDEARITAMRSELGRMAVEQFLKKMEGLGISRKEAAQIILEEEK